MYVLGDGVRGHDGASAWPACCKMVFGNTAEPSAWPARHSKMFWSPQTSAWPACCAEAFGNPADRPRSSGARW
eukprot:2592740-Alexandrium_andersonii.AAC.1